jgi:hypothetical protein
MGLSESRYRNYSNGLDSELWIGRRQTPLPDALPAGALPPLTLNSRTHRDRNIEYQWPLKHTKWGHANVGWMIKVCKWCEELVPEDRGPFALYCSKRHMKAANKGTRRRRTPLFKDTECKHCAKRFDQAYPDQEYCRTECSVAAHNKRRYARRSQDPVYMAEKNRWQSDYNKSRMASFATVMRLIKLQKCQDCDFVPTVPDQMDFDHRNPEEKWKQISDIHPMVQWRRVIRELQKCDLVCANCHRLRTFHQRQSVKE